MEKNVLNARLNFLCVYYCFFIAFADDELKQKQEKRSENGFFAEEKNRFENFINVFLECYSSFWQLFKDKWSGELNKFMGFRCAM